MRRCVHRVCEVVSLITVSLPAALFQNLYAHMCYLSLVVLYLLKIARCQIYFTTTKEWGWVNSTIQSADSHLIIKSSSKNLISPLFKFGSIDGLPYLFGLYPSQDVSDKYQKLWRKV